MGSTAAARMWAATEVRRRWRALVVLGLIAGLAAGTSLAAVAGARRTGSVLGRYRAATAAPDALVFGTQVGAEDLDYSAVAALPEVLDAGTFNLAPVGVARPPMGTLAPGDDHLYRTLARPLLVHGRLPRPGRDDEIVVNRTAAARYHLRVGQRVTVTSSTNLEDFFTDAPPTGGPTVRATVVGIGDSPIDAVFFADEPGFLIGGAFLARHQEVPRAPNLVVRLKEGTDVNAFHRKAVAALGLPDVPVRDLGEDRKRTTHATDLERTALLLFAAAASLAGLVLVGQALSRTVYAMAEASPALRAIGFTGRQLAGGLALPLGITAATAAVSTVAAALALSSRFPVGLGRRLEPDLGVHADWAVLVPGAAVVAALVAAGAVVAGLRAVRAGTRDAPEPAQPGAVAALRRAMPLPIGIGTGLALDRGRGGAAVPVRPALAGAVVGIVGVLGALGLVRGIDDALAHPARSGQAWDALVAPGDEHDLADISAALAGDHDAAAVAAVVRVPLDVDGAGLPAYALQPVRGRLSFAVLDGRAPTRAGEVALGPATAKALGKGIGDAVELVGDQGRARLRVVGLALLPQTPHSEFDQGVWTTPETLTPLAPPDEAGGSEVLARARAGVAPAAFARRQIERFGDASPPSAPQDVRNLANVRTLPRALALFLALLGVAAVGHALVTTVRRRRHDLAVLRALGFRPAQNGLCIVSQALTIAAVALLLGVPLGIAAGRLSWRWVADATPLLYVPPVAALAAVLVVPIALAVANALAAFPARRAARLRPAEVLRTE